ncbi:MAG TPA: carboxypeptidase-like regulatory domain-containing protein [Bacteroidia bacterium]|nr:carboxypeptidase-like regulatory domain-containing protein [Bacteroidia bacterium]
MLRTIQGVIFLILFLPEGFTLSGQTLVSARIMDSLSHQPMEFVNVGLPGKGLGTVSNEKGEFSLLVPDSLKNEILKISIIGYRSLSIPLTDIKQASTIVLAPVSVELQEVVVNPRKLKIKTLGNSTRSAMVTGGFKDNRLGAEMAVKMNISHKNTQIRKVCLNVVENSLGENPIFRINVYRKNQDGLPGENILRQNIIVEPKNKTGLIEVDLKPYFIFCDEDVYIAFEWIKDLGDVKSLYFSLKLVGEGMCYRQTSQASWEKISAIGVGIYAEVGY